MAGGLQEWWFTVHSTAVTLGSALATKALATLGATKPPTAHPAEDAAFRSLLTFADYQEQRFVLQLMSKQGLAQAQGQGACKVQPEVDGSATITLAAQGSAEVQPDVIVVYIHGGAFAFGTANNAAPVLAQMATALKAEHGLHCQVASLEYDLSPEHPFPTALAQVVDKLHALLQQWHMDLPAAGTDNQRCPPAVVLMGESAGGNLVLAALLALHQHCPVPALSHSLPPFAGALLLSPWTDLTAGAEVYLPAYPPGSTPWWQRLAGGAIPSHSSNSVQLQHVYPCTKHDQPAATCECVAQHRVRVRWDFLPCPFLAKCVERHVTGTLAKLPGTSAAAGAAAMGGAAGKVYDALLQQVKGCKDVEALAAHPLVSPSLADPAVLSAALRSLLHSPALVFGGELEVMLPDILKLVDRVNQAAGGGKLQAAGEQLAVAAGEAGATAEVRVARAKGRKGVGVVAAAPAGSAGESVGPGGLLYQQWAREVHQAAVLPGRDALQPPLHQYVADATAAWHARWQQAHRERQGA